MNGLEAGSELTPYPPAGNQFPIIEVSAGLIFRGGKLLITQRCAESHLGGLWEFPGGKREAGETFEQCLERELREELGVAVAVGTLFESIFHQYPQKAVYLKFFLSRIESGEPQSIGCAAIAWVGRTDLMQFEFPAADRQLLKRLIATDDLWIKKSATRTPPY